MIFVAVNLENSAPIVNVIDVSNFGLLNLQNDEYDVPANLPSVTVNVHSLMISVAVSFVYFFCV